MDKLDKPNLVEGPMIDEERQSLISHKGSAECATSSDTQGSTLSGILEQNQRLIFKYPDGSYSYAFKCQNKDGDNWLQLKGQQGMPPSREEIQQELSTFQVLQIEDEIEFLVNNLEYLVEPEVAIKSYF